MTPKEGLVRCFQQMVIIARLHPFVSTFVAKDVSRYSDAAVGMPALKAEDKGNVEVIFQDVIIPLTPKVGNFYTVKATKIVPFSDYMKLKNLV